MAGIQDDPSQNNDQQGPDGIPLQRHHNDKSELLSKFGAKLWDELANFITALSTVALVVYTWVLSDYAAQQTKIQNEQLKKIDAALSQTEKLIKNADAQTSSSMSQAQSSISQSKSAVQANLQSASFNRTQLRAYVVHQGITDFDEYGVVSAHTLKNVGATPAFNVTVYSRVTLLDRKDAERFLKRGLDIGRPEGDRRVLGANIDSKDDLQHSAVNDQGDNFVDHDFSEQEKKYYQQGKVVQWISGAVTYRDVFGDLHRTRFCIIRQAPRYLNEFCKENNDID